MASIKCGHCKQTHTSVIEVKQCAGLVPAAPRYAAQQAAMEYELGRRDSPSVSQDIHEGQQSRDEQVVTLQRRTSRVVTEQKVHNGPIRQVVTEAGMYRNPDTKMIYKVQKAVHGSGHLYAKRLEVHEDQGNRVSFEYAPGALRDLDARWRLSVEDAKQFGALYGSCMVCGRVLTNEESIAAGIGPICAGKM